VYTRFPGQQIAEKIDQMGDSNVKSYFAHGTGPFVPSGMVSAWAQYSVLTERRDDLERYLKDKGIPTAIYYPTPLHLQPAFSYLGYNNSDFPVSEDASRRILSLPMHPYLTDQELHGVAEAIKAFTKH
jgi:UDP-2-acetamido-2-deoxy-ribo-hexuluronate aminotransferase